MNFLCPSCRTPLPAPAGNASADCTKCGVKVDLTGIETAPGQAKLWPQIDLASETLGPFKLGHTLGAGGMGAVYAATSPTGIGCAVKVLSPLLAAEPGLRERFRREAHALRAVDHKGVVRILDEGEERGFSWYAMEKIEGRDLREVLRNGKLSAAETEGLARALLDALTAVHAAGLVHRDIKPGNILLSPEGPKLCDFGIARFDGQATLTESAAIMGSLRYMAPEQRWGKSGPLSDLYGVGVVLHEALYGGVPGEVAPSGQVPKWLEEFVLTLVQQRAEDRPPTAQAALKKLDRLKNRWKVRLAAAAAMVVTALAPVGYVFWPAEKVEAVQPESSRKAIVAETVVDAGPPADAGVAVFVRTAHDAVAEAEAQVVAANALRNVTDEQISAMTDDEKRTLLVSTGVPALANVSGDALDRVFRRAVAQLRPAPGFDLGSKTELPTKAPQRPGKLTATSVPTDAELWIDGKNTGLRSPVETELPPGKHALVFKRDGKQSLPRIVVITRDATYAVQEVPLTETTAAIGPPPKGKPVKGKSKKPSKIEALSKE